MQLPSSILGNKFGAKYVFGIGLLVTSVLSLLTPIIARTNLYLLIAVRALSGFSQANFSYHLILLILKITMLRTLPFNFFFFLS